MPYNPLNFVPKLIEAFFKSDIFSYFFIFIIGLAFVATVPIIIRQIISIFSK